MKGFLDNEFSSFRSIQGKLLCLIDNQSRGNNKQSGYIHINEIERAERLLKV